MSDKYGITRADIDTPADVETAVNPALDDIDALFVARDPEAWTTVTSVGTGFTLVGIAGAEQVKYSKTLIGVTAALVQVYLVELSGKVSVASGVTGSIFTLPSGYRPAGGRTLELLGLATGSSPSQKNVAGYSVDTSGVVRLLAVPGGLSGTQTLCFDGVSFRTDQ